MLTWSVQFARGKVAGIRATTTADTGRQHAWEIVGGLIDHAATIADHHRLQNGEDHLSQLI